jgi:Heterokaryon incompatibility protein (HET)
MPKRRRSDHEHQLNCGLGEAPKRKRSGHDLSNYQHMPLSSSSRQIRLIRLQASPMVRDAVKCDIETFNIDKVPAYEAISYAWGDASNRSHIKVGVHHRLLITKSLEVALRYIRYPKKERLLWADAVCIDQNNTAEKNEVVARMHNIYQDAQQVIVWLGQPIRPWSFRVILKIPDRNKGTDSFYLRGPCQIENRLNKNARDLMKFGQLPWFSRGWVLQEVCFARHIQVQYGHHLLSWEDFEKVATNLASILPDFLSGVPLVARRAYAAIREAMSDVIKARLRVLDNEQAMTLGSLMPFARTKCTSDPRDKIFAFLNLLPSVPSALQVNYGAEAKTIFTKVAQLLMREEVGLRLLAECEFTKSSQSEANGACIPSWVPDWARARMCDSLPGGLSHTFQGDEFSAGSHLRPTSNFEILGDILLLEAQIRDEILSLEPEIPRRFYTPDLRDLLLGHVCSTRNTDSCPLTPGTITCPNWEHFNEMWRRIAACNRHSQGLKITDVVNIRLHKWDHQNIIGRSLLLTSKCLAGWAPPGAACGDIISIIPGCHVPIVLRKIRDSGSVSGETDLSSATGAAQKQIQEERLSSYIVIGEACKFVTTCGRSMADKVFRCAWSYGGRGQAQLGQRQ